MAYKPDKHGRDHCPGGEDPIPCFEFPYVYRRLTTPEVISAGTNEALDWDETEIVGTNAAEHFVIPGAPGGNSVTNVRGSGVYHFLFAVKWETEFTQGTFLTLSMDGLGWYPSVYWQVPFSAGSPLRTDSCPTLNVLLRVDAGISSVDFQVCHGSGSGQTIIDAFARIAKVTTYPAGPEADFAFL